MNYMSDTFLFAEYRLVRNLCRHHFVFKKIGLFA